MTNPRRGRPSDYSFQVAISICARLAEGKSLRAICSEAGNARQGHRFPLDRTPQGVSRRVHTRLRASGGEDLADEMIEMIEIADDPCVWVEKIGADGRAVRVLDHENLARVRLRMKALERQAARMAPRKYGNRR